MNDAIAVELYPAPEFQIPVGPITIAAQELFATIIGCEVAPHAVHIKDESDHCEYFGGGQLQVVVTVSTLTKFEELEQIALSLVAALVAVIGNGDRIDLSLFITKGSTQDFSKMARVSTHVIPLDGEESDPVELVELPILEKDPHLQEKMGRVMRRMITEDPAVDDGTDALVIPALTGPILTAAG